MQINGYTIEPRANLRGANLWDCFGNQGEVKTLACLPRWSIVYTAEVLQIGCERHPLADWWGFDDDTITRMDEHALAWWHEHRGWIRTTIERFPATPAGAE